MNNLRMRLQPSAEGLAGTIENDGDAISGNAVEGATMRILRRHFKTPAAAM
ncbi:hypothetical protein J2Z31_004854 [Sinorhizobium kostiense]|uniref:Uncharacterized protein n=1 Tax=Sinorhizobium kostiense TaxID=76747 RepID=A0ABS4R5Z9_9HYPH|nr:hypothetical protein [Sinorhizobium kostiense]